MGRFYKSKAFIPTLFAVITIISLTLVITAIGANVISDSSNSYYFDSNAKNNGTGTQSSPFNTLDALEGLDVGPGDFIYIKKGSSFDGSLRLVNLNGSSTAPITVTTYGDGARPRIDGCDQQGEGVLYIENCSYITVSGLDICDTATYESDRRGVYIYGSSDGATAVYSGIVISDLYVHHIKGKADDSTTGAIVAACGENASFNGLTVTDCYINDVDGAGIAVYNEQSLNPYSADFAGHSHANVIISDNTVTDVNGNAVYLSDLYGGKAEGNTVYNVSGGASFVTECVYGTAIESNESYNNSSTSPAFYADSLSRDAVWQYNYSHDNNGGMFGGSSSDSRDASVVRFNLSVCDDGTLVGATGLNLNAYNNTFICDASTSPIILNSAAQTTVYRNNLVYNKSASASISTPASATVSNNLIFSEGGANISGLDAFKNVNTNGLYVDPDLSGSVGASASARSNIENAVYSQLKTNSVAISAGCVIDGAVTDFFGNFATASIGFYCGGGNNSPTTDFVLDAEDLKEYQYSDIEIVKDVLYGRATSYKGSQKDLLLDLYFANDCDNINRPLVVMIHGGGLRSDSTKEQSYAVKISKLLAAKGYVVASINYRTREGSDMPDKASAAPALMDAAEDVNTAINWLRGQGGVYGFNPDYIFVAGGSAGGAAAMTYAFAEDSRNFNKNGIVAVANLWGGPRDVYADCYDSDFSQDDRFPTIFIHGTGDTTMEYTHSLNAYNKMLEQGIIVSWNPIAGAEHSLIGYDDTYEMTVGLINDFFTAILAEKIAVVGYTQPPVATDRSGANVNLPESTPEKIYPNADLYVTSNSYGKNAAFNQGNSLYVYDSSNSSYIRHTYLRFDTMLDGEGAFPSEILLNFTVTAVTGASASTPLNLEVYGVADSYWFADEITWKDTPDKSNRVYIGTIQVTGTGNYSIDVSNYAFDMWQNGTPTVTFCFEGNDSPDSARRATIASSESGSSSPYLSCSFADGGIKTNVLSVNVSGEGSASIDTTTVIRGSSVTVTLTPNPGYVATNISIDTEDLGVCLSVNGNEILIENIVADTLLTVEFNPDPTILFASDSTTVRYNSQDSAVVNTTDTSIDGNVNPLFLCTKGPSGSTNNGSDRVIWLSFDIENFDFGSSDVYFEIYCYKTVDFSGATMPVDVYATTNTDWSSDTLAWGNQFLADGMGFDGGIFGISEGAQKIGSFGVTREKTWYRVDITSYVRALKMSGFTSFSLVLVDNDYTKTAPMARFVSTHGTASKDGESLVPRLVSEGAGSSNNKIDLNVSVNSPENGSVSGYTDVIADGSVNIRVIPDEGYTATAKVNGQSRPIIDGKLCLIGVDESTSVEISFLRVYSVTATSDSHSSVYCDKSSAKVGEQVTFSFRADAGYKLVVKVNGITRTVTDNQLKIVISSDTTVTVESIAILG